MNLFLGLSIYTKHKLTPADLYVLYIYFDISNNPFTIHPTNPMLTHATFEVPLKDLQVITADMSSISYTLILPTSAPKVPCRQATCLVVQLYGVTGHHKAI